VFWKTINAIASIYSLFLVCFVLVQIIIWSYKILCLFIRDYAIFRGFVFDLDTYWLFDNNFLIGMIFSVFILNLYIAFASGFKNLFDVGGYLMENLQFVNFSSCVIGGLLISFFVILLALFGSLGFGKITGFQFLGFYILVVLLSLFLMGSFSTDDDESLERIKNKVNPLKSFHESIINSMSLFFFGFLSILSGYFLGFFPLNTIIINGTTVGIIFSLFAVIPCIQYIVLRLILKLSGQTPWNITRLLDYYTERLILQRVGNRYRFIHRLVQEHFANLPIQPKN
jgi:hypothetical protein